MNKCNCNKNGSDVQDFLISKPGNTEADATYFLGLTHYTCGGRKMLAADVLHPVVANLTIEPIGEPVSLENGDYCQECQIAGTVTYKPCGSCCPRTEYVNYQLCLPCFTATSPKLGLGGIVASPKPISYYQNNGCGCCQGTYPATNQIAITTSINVTPGT